MAKKNLTQMQKLFCEEYVKTGEIKQSALNAGYSKDFACSKACKLLEKPLVKDYIKLLNKKTDKNNIMSIEEIQRFWTQTIQNEDESLPNRLRASDLLTRSQGGFIDKKEVDANLTEKVIFSGEDDIED